MKSKICIFAIYFPSACLLAYFLFLFRGRKEDKKRFYINGRIKFLCALEQTHSKFTNTRDKYIHANACLHMSLIHTHVSECPHTCVGARIESKCRTRKCHVVELKVLVSYEMAQSWFFFSFLNRNINFFFVRHHIFSPPTHFI